MVEPPSYGLLLPFAIAATSQMYRALRLRAKTQGIAGGGAAALIAMAYAPAALSIADPETLTPIAPAILWARYYLFALLTLAALAGAFLLRAATLLGANRMARMVASSQDAGHLLVVCNALQAIGCHDLALTGLSRLAEMRPSSSAVRCAIAVLLAIHRRFLAAEASARQAIELDPSNGDAFLCLSGALEEQGRIAESDAARAQAAKLGVELPQIVERRSALRS